VLCLVAINQPVRHALLVVRKGTVAVNVRKKIGRIIRRSARF
jgi:hypothetical protein